jgi:hypothetical protein
MLTYKFFDIPVYNAFGEKDHVQLFSIRGQFAHHGYASKHFGGGVLGQSGFNNITFAVMLQVDAVNNGLDQADTALSPFWSGAAAMKVKILKFK